MNTNRRNFLKKAGLGFAGLMAFEQTKIVGRTRDGYLVESENEYGGFTIEKLSNRKMPYEINPDTLKRMDDKNTVFSRNAWDPSRKDRPEVNTNLTYENMVEGKGVVPNQTRLDYALMSAAWGTASFRGSPFYNWGAVSGRVKGMSEEAMGKWDPADLDMTWEETSMAVKHAALFFGASLAGIAKMNPLWLYNNIYSPTPEDRNRTIPVLDEDERLEKTEEAHYIPSSMNNVVALAFEEDYDAIMNSPGRLASAACGDGYSRMAVTSYKLAEFIRALGYRALPAGNNVGLSIPIAIDAGLGELGRNGLLITPKYGPRVRLAKVITDMPLVADSTIRFGVREFCEECKICADDCPSESISTGPMSWEGTSISNNPGSLKWYVKHEGCYDYNGFSCSNCKRNCPFNKPNNSWLHKVIREGISLRSKNMGKLMVKMDQASGYGVQSQNTEFWQKDGSKSITAREEM